MSDLKRFGYAPGSYLITCYVCGKVSQGCDKRAISCLVCAEAAETAEKKDSTK